MEIKAQIMDESAMMRSLARITHEIIERNGGADDIILMGIKTRGYPIAEILRDNLLKFAGVSVPCGYIDISFYRDDLTEISELPETNGSHFPVSIKDKTVILVDDVIYTGRTVRAAIEAVFKDGRPRAVQLAVLIDRGHRELPIKPDYVGKNVPTSNTEVITVNVATVDGENKVSVASI